MRGWKAFEGVKRSEKLKNTGFELNDLPGGGGRQASFHVEHIMNMAQLSRGQACPLRYPESGQPTPM